MELLDPPGLSPALQRGFLRAAGGIESNSECAKVLDAFATHYPVSDPATREVFLAALETVDSDTERNRLFVKVMK